MTSDFRLLSDWIESNGGPLLLASQDSAELWQGGIWEDEASHYRAACDVDDWTGLVAVEGRQFAVISGDPLPTVAARYKEATLLLRGFYADSDEDLIHAAAEWLSRLDSIATPDCKIDITFRAGSLVLFDSAYPGIADHGGASFTIDHPAESIRTYFVKSDEQTAFLVDWIA